MRDDAIGAETMSRLCVTITMVDPFVAIDVAEEADDLAACVGIEVAGRSSARRTRGS